MTGQPTASSVRRRTTRLVKLCAEQVRDPEVVPTLPTFRFVTAAPELRRPFAAEAVRFKVQEPWASTPGEPLDTASIVAYIDARTVYARLNTVCSDLWSMAPVWLQGRLWCHLTIDGITRPDLGEGYRGKGLWSDAVKRAAVPFGVGESLYASPRIQLAIGEGDDALMRACVDYDARDKRVPWLKLTPLGMAHCRNIYREWLLKTGIAAFGEPIDHGDLTNSQGDIEITGPPMPAPPERTRQLDVTTTGGATTGGATMTVTPGRTGPPPASPEQAAEDHLAVMLSVRDDGLWPLRNACHTAMIALGYDAVSRLRELQGAKDGKGLDGLLARLSTVKDIVEPGEPEEPGKSDEEEQAT